MKYEFTMKIDPRMDILDQAFSEYCYQEEAYRLFCKKYQQAKKTGEYYKTPEVYNGEYWLKERGSVFAWDAFAMICRFNSLDPDAAVKVFKAIRRNMQYQQRWERQASFNYNRRFEWEPVQPGSVESFFNLCRES